MVIAPASQRSCRISVHGTTPVLPSESERSAVLEYLGTSSSPLGSLAMDRALTSLRAMQTRGFYYNGLPVTGAFSGVLDTGSSYVSSQRHFVLALSDVA